MTPSYSGFVNTEGPSALTPGPACTSTAPASGAARTYTTSCSGASDPNYTILRTVTVGHLPAMEAVDAHTTPAFVTNSVEHTAGVRDASSGNLVQTVALPGEPDLMATDARIGRVFVLDDLETPRVCSMRSVAPSCARSR